MAKKPYRPTWFTVRFDQTSEWATLHVPEAHAVEWLLGAARLFNETLLWNELLGVQAILLEQIKRRDWSKVSPWHLVLHLKVAHDVKEGMANFLPPPYRSWPLDVRQALYLAHCLMKGHAMVEDNPAEDFDLPTLAHFPIAVRPVLAAVKPLWNCLAEPAVRAAIQYHRSHHEAGFDAGLLKLVTELGESPDATHWLTLLGETPEALCKRMMEIPKLRMADHVYKSREPEATMRGLMNDIFLDDLKAKTHRGMAGQALKGFSTGSRVYGYRRVPIEDPTKADEWGRPVIVAVKREIDEDKAQWVRRMFTWYADGKSLRWICSELDRLHVPTPGAQDRRTHPSQIAGLWFARRLAGGSATFTGMLENSTYIGRVTWNRREWLTDPETKRKHARMRPDTEWIVTERAVEPIVSLPLWQKVQARLQSVRRRTEVPMRGRGPKFLLSGLLRCGVCHRRFVVRDATRYGCPAHRVLGCANEGLVARTLVEDKILTGIRTDLFLQEGIELFVKETTSLLRERHRQQHPDRTTAQQKQQLKHVERKIANIMTAIEAGIFTTSTKQALEHAEAERASLLAAPPPHIKALTTLATFSLPNATARYRTIVDGLAALPLKHVEQAREQIKALVGDIILWPTPAGHLEAELTGNYAGFLKLAVGQYGQPYGPQNNGLYPPQ